MFASRLLHGESLSRIEWWWWYSWIAFRLICIYCLRVFGFGKGFVVTPVDCSDCFVFRNAGLFAISSVSVILSVSAFSIGLSLGAVVSQADRIVFRRNKASALFLARYQYRMIYSPGGLFCFWWIHMIMVSSTSWYFVTMLNQDSRYVTSPLADSAWHGSRQIVNLRGISATMFRFSVGTYRLFVFCLLFWFDAMYTIWQTGSTSTFQYMTVCTTELEPMHFDVFACMVMRLRLRRWMCLRSALKY